MPKPFNPLLPAWVSSSKLRIVRPVPPQGLKVIAYHHVAGAPTQKAIKTMLITGTRVAATPKSVAKLPTANSSNNSALIVTFLIMAILIGIVAVAINSSSENPQPNNKKPKTINSAASETL